MADAKSLVKEAAKTAVSYANKKHNTGRPKLYTEEERKRLASLRSSKNYYEKRMDALTELPDMKITLASVRHSLSEDTSVNCYYAGYFDPSNSDKYYGMDFRTWMTNNGDIALLEQVLADVNLIRDENSSIGSDPKSDTDDMIEYYRQKIKDIQSETDAIRSGANNRKEENLAKEVARKNRIKNGNALIDTLDESSKFIKTLSNPEQAALNEIKKKLAESVIKNIDLGDMDDDQQLITKHSIYTGILNNPKAGIRQAITETVVSDVMKEYGYNEANVVGSLVDLATGSGSVKTVGLSIFKGVVNKSGLNKALMDEKAEELIDIGESTPDYENIKMLGRDVLVNIGKNIIKSGGNIYAAIPMIIKDVLLDAGKAGLRKAKQGLKK